MAGVATLANDNVLSCRSDYDSALANDDTTLYFAHLKECGWVDPTIVQNPFPMSAALAAMPPSETKLQSIYVSNRRHRSLAHIDSRSETLCFAEEELVRSPPGEIFR